METDPLTGLPSRNLSRLPWARRSARINVANENNGELRDVVLSAMCFYLTAIHRFAVARRANAG